MQLSLQIPISYEAQLIASECIQPVSEYHITLKYFGEVSRAEFAEIKRRLDFCEFKPFSLKLAQNYDCFANWSRVRTLYIPVESQRLIVLQEQVTNMFSDIFKTEKFVPHMTVARVHKNTPQEILHTLRETELESIEIPVTYMVLCSSQILNGEQKTTVEKKIHFS